MANGIIARPTCTPVATPDYVTSASFAIHPGGFRQAAETDARPSALDVNNLIRAVARSVVSLPSASWVIQRTVDILIRLRILEQKKKERKDIVNIGGYKQRSD